MFCPQQCLVAYDETDDKRLKKALVLQDALSDLPKVSIDLFTLFIYSFISGMLLEFCYASMNYNVFYRFQTINLMISWRIALTPKQSSSATSGSAVKV